MPAAVFQIDRFPAWSVRAQHKVAPRADWIRVGLEHDFRKMIDLWQRYLYQQVTIQLDFLALPDDNGVMWQLHRRLVGNALRQPLVMVRDGYVSIDRRHLASLREGFELLGEFLEADHRTDMYEWDEEAGEDGKGDYVRKNDATSAAVDLKEARAMYAVIDSINALAADNVVKIMEDA